jgi:hypothetical protein
MLERVKSAILGGPVMILGSCACGSVQYKVDGELKDFSHCHCSICRKLHGAAFATWGGVDRANLSIDKGEELLKAYSFSKNTDSIFCSKCGSPVFADYKPDQKKIYLTLGTVDSKLDCPPGFHEFVDSKAPWFEITDDLPKFRESS